MAQYYIMYNGNQVGPMSKETLLSYGLQPNSQVWCEGLPQWVAAYTIPELMELINSNNNAQSAGCPPQPNACPPQPICQSPAKDRIVFAILAFFVGELGIQYFYIGKTAAGLITILLTFVTCGLWGIVILIQAIMVLCGTQQEFERKFVNSTSTFPLF